MIARKSVVLGFALALLAAGCGDDNEGGGAAPGAGAPGAASPSFTVRIENVSDAGTLSIPGGMKPVPLSPGAFAIHGEGSVFFQPGAMASEGLEGIAEDGMPEGLVSMLGQMPVVKQAGIFSTAMGGDSPHEGPLTPGQFYEFTISTASPGDRLSLATMFVESNDWFFATPSSGVPLFGGEGGSIPVSGDLTPLIGLWDAGTERDETLGVGDNQAPRQRRPNTGPQDEDGRVQSVIVPGRSMEADFASSSPAVDQVIRVTITANGAAGTVAPASVAESTPSPSPTPSMMPGMGGGAGD